MREKVFVVHWHGPFTKEEVAGMDESGVVYLVTGRMGNERKSRIKYFGITNQSICARFKRHHKLAQDIADLQVWIGWIMHSPTNKPKLETVEKLMIYLWQPPLNERKTVGLPKATSLLCHWFDSHWKPLREKPNSLKDVYDVMCWDGEYWRTGQLERWKN